MEFFAEMDNRYKSLTIFAKNSIIDLCQGPKYALETYCKRLRPAITYSKLTVETLEQGVKYNQSQQ